MDELRRDEELLATLPERYASGKPISLQDASSMVELVKGHRGKSAGTGFQRRSKFLSLPPDIQEEEA